MQQLQKSLGYTFKNEELLITALTHSSYANENGDYSMCNERMEFLGDSVLSVIVSEYIFKNLPDQPEGKLTKLRASLVCEKTLSGFSNQINLGKYLRLGHGEVQNKGNERPSILADAFEAVLAALYLDGGRQAAENFVLPFILSKINDTSDDTYTDYKTLLQEVVQKNPEERLTYRLAAESGPDHDKVFTAEVFINSNLIGTGTGHSKKKAEQQAAKQALELMGITK